MDSQSPITASQTQNTQNADCSPGERSEKEDLNDDSSTDFKGDVTRDNLQGRFLVQRSVAMLEQCCNHLK